MIKTNLISIPVCEPMLAGNELKYITDAVSTGWISSAGSYVTAFEKAFAEYCGVKHGIAVCNGTVALHLALRALGVQPGDEVIIPDFTMIASALAVCYCGAKPVFVDADAATWNMDVSAVEQYITPATKGIMAVHIFGNPCDMTALQRIADRHGLWLMEDAAEAHGAINHGKKAGALSRIAAFSFFANKNVTTGEGGMVVTDDDELAAACRYFKNMCFPLDAPRTYLHADIGYNYRMSNLHAAIGLAQTEKADDYKALRQAISGTFACHSWCPAPGGHNRQRKRQLDERAGHHARLWAHARRAHRPSAKPRYRHPAFLQRDAPPARPEDLWVSL